MPYTAARTATRDENTGRYQRHRLEQTLLSRIVEEYYPAFAAHLAEQGREQPDYVHHEFEDYLKFGRLEHGFLRVRCESCHAEHLVALICKRRGFCPSCGARRMAGSAALLVDEVLPEQPMRQWVLSFPFQLTQSLHKFSAQERFRSFHCGIFRGVLGFFYSSHRVSYAPGKKSCARPGKYRP